jgi:hypothetical protein
MLSRDMADVYGCAGQDIVAHATGGMGCRGLLSRAPRLSQAMRPMLWNAEEPARPSESMGNAVRRTLDKRAAVWKQS